MLILQWRGLRRGGIAECLDERRSLKPCQELLLLMTFLNCIKELGYNFGCSNLYTVWVCFLFSLFVLLHVQLGYTFGQIDWL